MIAKLVSLSAALLVTASAASAQMPPSPPKLIVAIAVDQFSSDVFSQYRPFYTSGLKRLSGGIVFPRGHQSHAATETCPGHSTILTGSRPARTGIIANDWQDPKLPRPTKDGKKSYEIYCAEQPQAAASDFMAGGAYVVSSQFLKVPTLGDRMKDANPASRVVAVSGKDRAAVMMGGHKADATIWWDGKAFTTYAGRTDELPASVTALTARAQAQIAKDWAGKVPAHCAPLTRAVSMTDKISVGTAPVRKAGNERGWRASEQFDNVTLDVGLAMLGGMKLGQGPAPDLLALSFSATDYVGHSTGTEGAEMCTQIAALDQILGRLFAALDKTGVPYVVTLTADHGGHDIPERNRTNALPSAERVDKMLSAAAVGAVTAKQLGLDGSALIGRAPFGDMYLAPTVPAEKRAEVLKAAVATYRAHRQVAAVFTKDEVMVSPGPMGPPDEWTLLERVKASFDPDRSGDFIVLLKPYVTPIPDTGQGYFATHGSPWGYDRRVPILFWWKGVAGFEQPNAIETVDIMPTLASLLGLPVDPASIDGRCLDLEAGTPSNCAK